MDLKGLSCCIAVQPVGCIAGHPLYLVDLSVGPRLLFDLPQKHAGRPRTMSANAQMYSLTDGPNIGMRTAQHPTLPSTVFTHKPLDRSKQEIRLFRMVKDAKLAGTSTISCEVTHHTLNGDQAEARACPDYVAGSYCWGGQDHKELVLMNGRLFKTSKNLYSLLQVLRDDEEGNGRFYWIDQLCIDQTSTLERNHQVQLMSIIYSQAYAVYSWFGDQPPGAQEAFCLVEQLV